MSDLGKLIEAVESGVATAMWFHGALGRNSLHAITAFNGSLDEAKALHEVLLPGHWINDMRSHCGPSCENYVTSVATKIGKKVYAWDGVSKVQSRAWLLAILKAYRSEVEK